MAHGAPRIAARRVFGDGIGFALSSGVWSDEDRLEHLCRMGLLAVMLLHWIVFALLVSTSAPDESASAASGNLAHVFSWLGSKLVA